MKINENLEVYMCNKRVTQTFLAAASNAPSVGEPRSSPLMISALLHTLPIWQQKSEKKRRHWEVLK